MKYSNKYEGCFSWNCCDENLHACIDRSEYVKNIRKKLRKKRYKKILANKFISK
ncbi:MAG: hypothetical protein ACFFCL_02405 [Promethearchaeota archaeon]